MMGKNLVTWKVSNKVTMFPIFDGEIAGKLLIRNKTVFSPLFSPANFQVPDLFSPAYFHVVSFADKLIENMVKSGRD